MWSGDLAPTSSRAVAEYLSVLDDAAFGAAPPVEPNVISPGDPAARYTATAEGPAVFAYSDNYLVDVNHVVIIDVETRMAIRQAEVRAAKGMLDRTTQTFGIMPSRLIGDAGYGSAEVLGWLVEERGIEPQVKVLDKSERTDGTFSRSAFAYDPQADFYVCPAGKQLRKRRGAFSALRSDAAKDGSIRYRASKFDCEACALKAQCCSKEPARKVARSIHEAARDKACAIAQTPAYVVSRRERKKVEMLFAHLKRILRMDRLRAWTERSKRRVLVGRRRPESPESSEDRRPSADECRDLRGAASLSCIDARRRLRCRPGFFNGIGRFLLLSSVP